MAGSHAGGVKTAATNKSRYGEDFYRKMGKKGGSAPYTGSKGFAAHPEIVKAAGEKGGRISRRGKNSEKKFIILKDGVEVTSFLFAGNSIYSDRYPWTLVKAAAKAVGNIDLKDFLEDYEIESTTKKKKTTKKDRTPSQAFSEKLSKIRENPPKDEKTEKSRISSILSYIRGKRGEEE